MFVSTIASSSSVILPEGTPRHRTSVVPPCSFSFSSSSVCVYFPCPCLWLLAETVKGKIQTQWSQYSSGAVHPPCCRSLPARTTCAVSRALFLYYFASFFPPLCFFTLVLCGDGNTYSVFVVVVLCPRLALVLYTAF